MEGMQGWPRLPRRSRAALLLRAACALARDGVGTDHGAPSRSSIAASGSRLIPIVLEPAAHDGARAHAVEPPALCRLDARADQATGRRDRTQYRNPHRDHHARARAPRAGLPRLGRYHPAGQEPWPRPAGGGLRPGAGDRRTLLHLRQFDPEEQPRSQTARTCRGRAVDCASQHPWPPLLPLRRTQPMLTHPTLDQLKTLKLDGMADAFVELQAQGQAADLAHAEWLALLLDREAANRNTRRFQIRLRSAKLRHGQAAIEDADYRTPRRLDKALFQQLASGKWIAEHHNLLVTGPCGIGKSWLSCALAQKACRDGYTVHYARVPRLFADLELAHGDGRFARLFRTLTKADLLILDDWGPDRFTASQRRDLMEIVEDRYGAGSTLITSQLPVDAWHEVIGDPTFADAILDRLVHNAYRLALDGPSMRDPNMSRSDTTGPVAEMADATATKSAKAVKK